MKKISVLLGALIPIALGLSNSPSNIARYPTAVPYEQAFLDGYSPLKHMGSLGPYSNAQSFGVGRDPPDGCTVDQVIMIRRHGERYPTASQGPEFEAVVQKLFNSGIKEWQKDLSFLNDWHYFVPDDSLYELESETGPYSGLLAAYLHGVDYSIRYGHLWDQYKRRRKVVPFWASGDERVVQTAREFSRGFFGWNYTKSAALNIISEDDSQGANTLTPDCDYGNDICENLDNYMPIFNVAAARMNEQNPGLHLNYTDIATIMAMTAFELNVKGYSDWVNAFTLDEWVSFGYIFGKEFYYCWGPGDPHGIAVGSIYANASLTLLNEGPESAGSLFFNFAHDLSITPILNALNVAVPPKALPLDRIPFPNAYEIGNIMPMGGRLTLERLNCTSLSTKSETYVRAILNEAVYPFTDCQDGPGYSCSLQNYTNMVKGRVQDFPEVCKLDKKLPQHLSFWWDYNTTTKWNYQTEAFIPFQGYPIV